MDVDFLALCDFLKLLPQLLNRPTSQADQHAWTGSVNCDDNGVRLSFNFNPWDSSLLEPAFDVVADFDVFQNPFSVMP
jgi:hypothetical protein